MTPDQPETTGQGPEPANGSADEQVLLEQQVERAREAVVRSYRVVKVPDYFLDEWLPILGPSRWLTVLAFRQVAFLHHCKERSGLQPAKTTFRELARWAGQSHPQIHKLLRDPGHLAWFIAPKAGKLGHHPRSRASRREYLVRIEIPLTPADQGRLERFLNDHRPASDEGWLELLHQAQAAKELPAPPPLALPPSPRTIQSIVQELRGPSRPLTQDLDWACDELLERWQTQNFGLASHYFLRRWLPDLTPGLGCLVLWARRHASRDAPRGQTGRLRADSWPGLATAVAASAKTARRWLNDADRYPHTPLFMKPVPIMAGGGAVERITSDSIEVEGRRLVITPATRVLDIVHLGDLVEVTAEDRPAAWAAVSVRLAVGPLERAGFARSRLHFDVSLTDPVHPQDAARYATLLDSLSADETDVPVLQPTDGNGRPRPTGNTLRTKVNKAGVNASMARDRATKGGPGVAEMPPTVNNLSPDSNSAPSNVSGQGRGVNALRGSKIPSDQDQQSIQEPQPHVVAAQTNESVGFHNQEPALLARITHRRQELFTELALSRQIRVQLEDLWPTRGGDFVGWLLWSLATPTIESPGIHAWSRVSDGQSPPEEYRQIVEVAAGWLESAYSPPPAAFREAGAALREARLSDALRRILFAADSSGETGENREGAGSVSGPLAGDDEGALRPTQEAARLWELARGQLQLELPRGDFDTWVRDLQPVRLEEGALVVRAGNEYAKRWIEDRLAASAARILSGLTPETRQLRIEVGGPSSDERARA